MNGRVLVVDDDKPMTQFLGRVLRPEGYEVLIAHDGDEALTLFHDELPDLVLLDLMLPRQDGIAVCDQIRSSYIGLVTPVVLITGHSTEVSKYELMKQHGLADLLVKPVSVEKLRGMAQWLLTPVAEGDTATYADAHLDAVAVVEGEAGAFAVGNLGVAAALLRIAQERSTGSLVVARGAMRRALAFRGGQLVSVRSNVLADRLDRILIKMRRARPAEVESGLAHASPDNFDADLLEALQLLDVIDRKASRQAIHYRALTVALRLLRWDAGLVRFLDDEVLPGSELGSPVSSQNLLLLGLRRNRAWRQQLAPAAAADDSMVVRSDGRLGGCDLDRIERSTLDLATNPVSVRYIKRVAQLAQVDAEPSLTVLLAAGLLKTADQAPVGAAAQEWPRLEVEELPQTGDTSAYPLPELLGRVISGRLTGTLYLESLVRRALSFENGELTLTRSTHPPEMIGHLLGAAGVRESSISRALTIQAERRDNSRMGGLLFRMGAISLEGLKSALQQQFVATWRAAFAGPVSEFRLDLTASETGRWLDLERPMTDLLRDGIAEVYVSRFKGRILGPRHRIVPTQDDLRPESLPGLNPLEQCLLASIISAPGGLDPQQHAADDQALRAIYFLTSLGIVRVVQLEAVTAVPQPAVVVVEPVSPSAVLPAESEVVFELVQDGAAAQPSRSEARAEFLLEHIEQEFARYRLKSEAAVAAANQEIGRLQERIRLLEAPSPPREVTVAAHGRAAKKPEAATAPEPKAPPRSPSPRCPAAGAKPARARASRKARGGPDGRAPEPEEPGGAG